MQEKETVHGFRVIRKRESKELGGTLWELRHEKTGAALYWTENGEENKLFCVTFKTLPFDNTGVFHILEHSVLCGSESFPVREPFLDLLKSSMNTFLNAFTSSDHTSFPVSSKNEKDFLNLTHVYLDAVFRPLLLTNELIFRQEGWRIDFGGDAPEYNGVVFNEMKGATASESRCIFSTLCRALFPDNCYGYNSGGDPDAITDLTYDAFLSAYRTFYHPSNAIFYLDGDVPTDRVLPLISSYLDRYEKDDTPHEIARQDPSRGRGYIGVYECGKEEPLENKMHLGFGKLIGRFDDRVRLAALQVLQKYLFDSNESPVKRALLQTGLVKDASFLIVNGTAQPFAALVLRGTMERHRDTLYDTLHDAVRALLAKGLDPADLHAAIDQMELSMRHLDEPQGLERARLLSDSCLYGGDPLLYLENDCVIRRLREDVGTDAYTRLIKEFLLDESDTAEILVMPEPEKGETDRANEKKKLTAMLSAMTPEQRAAEEEKYARLKTWQDTPDSPAAKQTIPTLTLSDVDPAPERFLTERRTAGEREIFHHAYKTNGICYFNLLFNIADVDPADLSALSFITELLAGLPTEDYSGARLQREIKRLFGGFSASVTPITRLSPNARTPVFFRVSFSALASKLSEAFGLAAQILLHTAFDDKDRIRKILTQVREGARRYICQAGHRLGTIRALAAQNAEHAVLDAASGIRYYFWLRDFEKEFDAKADAFVSFAARMMQRICTLSRLTISETSDEFHDACFAYLAAFPAGDAAACEEMTIERQSPRREAFIIPGGVSCAVQCAPLEDLGVGDRGDMEALSQALSYDYLWNEIRVRGGAYGCGCLLNATDGIRFRSYRDPDPARSLRAFAGAPDYIRAFCAGEESLDKYIISASAEPLREAYARGRLADAQRIGGITYALRSRRRKELLDATKEDLASYGALFDRAKSCASFCVIGSREAVDALDGDWQVSEI